MIQRPNRAQLVEAWFNSAVDYEELLGAGYGCGQLAYALHLDSLTDEEYAERLARGECFATGWTPYTTAERDTPVGKG